MRWYVQLSYIVGNLQLTNYPERRRQRRCPGGAPGTRRLPLRTRIVIGWVMNAFECERISKSWRGT